MLYDIQDLIRAYKTGLPACTFDQRHYDKLMGGLKNPTFGSAAPSLESGKGKKALLYKAVQKFVPTFGGDEAQLTEDCTSHAVRNCGDIARAVEIVSGQDESFYLRGATEGIYGSRGHSSGGMAVSTAADFLNSRGGILVRQKYGKYDLSKYNPNLAIEWGRTGVPKELLEIAKKNQVLSIANILSIKEAIDALFNGYPIAVGSNLGFSEKRDKNGISRQEGSWNHAMCVAGYDDTREVINKCLFLIQNSWGLFNSGPKLHEQPDGSFWIVEDDFYAMLMQKAAWVFSNVVGFPSKKINWTLHEVFG